MNNKRRNVLSAFILGAGCSVWVQPIVNAVVLPAHGQTSQCITDKVMGGSLQGNPAQADSCQAACEFVAEQQNAQLCLVETTEPATGTQCSCELDLPAL
ncbi:MAG: hypothetical protein V3V09_06625 [Arenicellales bacterium]